MATASVPLLPGLTASPSRGARADPSEQLLPCGGGLEYESPQRATADLPVRKRTHHTSDSPERTSRSRAAAKTAAPPPTPKRAFMPTPKLKSQPACSPQDTPVSAPQPRPIAPAPVMDAAPTPTVSIRKVPRGEARPLSANLSLANSNAGTPLASSRLKVPAAPAASQSSLEARRNARRAAGPPMTTPGTRNITPVSRPTTPQGGAMLAPAAHDPSTPLARPSSPQKFRAKLTEGLPGRKRDTPASTPRGLGISVPPLGSRSSPRHKAAGNVKGMPPVDVEGEEDVGESSFCYVDNAEAEEELADAGTNESVKVHVRLRPPKIGEKCAWIPAEYSSTLSLEPSIGSARVQPGANVPFHFDSVHTGSSNRPVYVSVARPLVRAALGGYDAVIFAYGQTASGKTFTLSGDEAGKEPGIIPRAVRDVFRGIRQSERTREWLLRASYLEIHNEVVKDLLDPDAVPQIRQDTRKGGKGTFVAPLREEVVTSQAAVRDLLARGQENRHVGATDWNERSSRSHTCLKLTIESWERDDESYQAAPEGSSIRKKIRISELSLIDLAGSEKYVSQGADRRTEGANINKSLLTLGKVIYALGERTSSAAAAANHVPYRDSKLTRILQNSLSGNARVAVVCTINPSPNAVDESLSTLAFAKRVKKVSLHAKRNEIDAEIGGMNAEAQALLVRYRDEAEELRRQVMALQSGAVVLQTTAEPRGDVAALEARLLELEAAVMRGEGASGGDSEDEKEAAAPLTQEEVEFTPYLARSDREVREELVVSLARVAELEEQIAKTPSLPADWNQADETAREAEVARLQQQARELEVVCAAQQSELDQVDKGQRALAQRVVELEKRAQEQQLHNAELQAQLAHLNKMKRRLQRFLTADMVGRVAGLQPASPAKGSAGSILASSLGLGARPASAQAMSRTRFADSKPGSPLVPADALARSTGPPKAIRPRTRTRRSISQDSGSLLRSLRPDVAPEGDSSLSSSADFETAMRGAEASIPNTKSSLWLTQNMDDLLAEIPNSSLADLTE